MGGLLPGRRDGRHGEGGGHGQDRYVILLLVPSGPPGGQFPVPFSFSKRHVADIIKMREGMWEKVEARKHTVNKVFPASFREGGDADADEIELMLFGNVEYSLKGAQGDGGAAAVDWAGYAKLKRTAGEWKFAYYRVYLQK